MSADNTREKSPDLQFDRAVSGTSGPTDTSTPQVRCSVCSRPIAVEYYHVNGATVCQGCARQAQAGATTARGAGPLVRAGIFGLGAAIAGAAIYYAVIAIANLEIGIVAILIGYMVGYAVRKGAAGRGGKRFQILAAVLTYWAVGLAYTPLAMKELTGSKTTSTQSADSASKPVTAPADSTNASVAAADSSAVVRAPDSATSLATKEASADKKSGMSAGLAILVLIGLVFALPVLSIVGSMPSGLISAFIIFIGLRQAWRMTAAPTMDVSGPYKIGSGPPTTPR